MPARTRPRASPLCAAALALGWVLSASLARAYVVASDASGRPLTWRGPNVHLVVVAVPGSLGSDLLSATEGAARRWSDATGLDISVRADPGASPHVSEDGRTTVVIRTQRWCPDDPSLPCHDPSRHALTQLYTRPVAGDPSAAEILEADIEVNAVHFDWRALPPRSLDAVLLHELGHVIGLDHTCGASSSTERVDDRGAPVPRCREALAAVRAAVMYPDPLEPVAGGREELSDDERRAGAELYAGSFESRGGSIPMLLLIGLGSMSAFWLARKARRARSSHGARR